MDHKTRKIRTQNADMTVDAIWVPPYDTPQIDPLPELDTDGLRMVSAFRLMTEKHPEECILHFFCDDYIFERFWQTPTKYLDALRRYRAVVMTDYSMYWDWPRALNVYNHWRNHTLARFWQDNGITVIPASGWTTARDFDWCFTGDPKESVMCVSTIGVAKNVQNRKRFNNGYAEMVKRNKPKKILLYGTDVRTDENKNAAETVVFRSYDQERKGINGE